MATEQRWDGIERPYDAATVDKLRGSLPVEHTLARHGAEKLWKLLHERDYFEEVAMAITGGESETTALSGSTEESQFQG